MATQGLSCRFRLPSPLTACIEKIRNSNFMFGLEFLQTSDSPKPSRYNLTWDLNSTATNYMARIKEISIKESNILVILYIYIYLHYINIISNHRGILRIPLRDAMIPKSLPDAAADAWPIAHPWTPYRHGAQQKSQGLQTLQICWTWLDEEDRRHSPNRSIKILVESHHHQQGTCRIPQCSHVKKTWYCASWMNCPIAICLTLVKRKWCLHPMLGRLFGPRYAWLESERRQPSSWLCWDKCDTRYAQNRKPPQENYRG